MTFYTEYVQNNSIWDVRLERKAPCKFISSVSLCCFLRLWLGNVTYAPVSSTSAALDNTLPGLLKRMGPPLVLLVSVTYETRYFSTQRLTHRLICAVFLLPSKLCPGSQITSVPFSSSQWPLRVITITYITADCYLVPTKTESKSVSSVWRDS